MMRHLTANLLLLAATVGLCCVVYPATLWGVGQLAFPSPAQGSLVTNENGQVVGSRLIAQPFTDPTYFWPRPSAVGYNAAASGASNWGASNPALRARVVKALETLPGQIPADLVTASGSGLDPHITLKGAMYQLDRVASARAERLGRDPKEVRKEIEEMLQKKAAAPLGGLAGVPMVNVLEVNLELDR